MIVTRITGGIGNQMFQYAFGRCLAERHQTELKLDLTHYSSGECRAPNPVRTYDLDIFNISETIATNSEIAALAKRVNIDLMDRALNRLLGVKESHVREPHFHFSRTAFESPDNVYLSGYWQSEKYFAEIEDIIRREFTFRDAPSAAASAILSRIQQTNSVCVHVRRGDFLVNPLNGLYGVDYFKAAEKITAKSVQDPNYFVFSDDIEWCEANLHFDGPSVFVSDDFGGRKFRDDLRLMSACKHFIIANSSFSWWAAWLNGYKDKLVIAPPNWATDISIDKSDMYLPGWIRMGGI